MFKPQFEYKLSFGWWVGSYFRNDLPQEHFEDKCFLPFQTFMLIQAWASLKQKGECVWKGIYWRYWWENSTTVVPVWSFAYLISPLPSLLLSHQSTSHMNFLSTLSPKLFPFFSVGITSILIWALTPLCWDYYNNLIFNFFVYGFSYLHLSQIGHQTHFLSFF